jgi:hypothetical protein
MALLVGVVGALSWRTMVCIGQLFEINAGACRFWSAPLWRNSRRGGTVARSRRTLLPARLCDARRAWSFGVNCRWQPAVQPAVHLPSQLLSWRAKPADFTSSWLFYATQPCQVPSADAASPAPSVPVTRARPKCSCCWSSASRSTNRPASRCRRRGDGGALAQQVAPGQLPARSSLPATPVVAVAALVVQPRRRLPRICQKCS